MHSITEYFPQSFVISRLDRTDRRRACDRALARIAWPVPVEYWPGVIVTENDGFPSAAIRGCFLGHLGALKEARLRDLRRVIILEDDCDPSPHVVSALHELSGESWQRYHWDLCYFGHGITTPPKIGGSKVSAPYHFRSVQGIDPVGLLHCYAVDSAIYDPMIEFLERCCSRPAGHPDGGKQYIDGAVNMFRAASPSVRTMIAIPSLASQRPSRSDLHPRWFDTTPVLRSLASVIRRCRAG